MNDTTQEKWVRGEPQESGADFYDDRTCDVCDEHFGHGDAGIPMTCDVPKEPSPILGNLTTRRTLHAFVHEPCAVRVETEGSAIVSYRGQRHTMERVQVFMMTCGNCGKTWYENWGSMDDISGMDPEYGMDGCCEHCRVDLPVHIDPPN